MIRSAIKNEGKVNEAIELVSFEEPKEEVTQETAAEDVIAEEVTETAEVTEAQESTEE